MNPSDPTLVPAKLHNGGDGDTFDLLCNFLRRSTWRGAVVVNIRLLGWRAQENEGPERDKPELGPKGEIIRVSGRDAKQVTTMVLGSAKGLRVLFTGLNDRGREICDVWIDQDGKGYVPLGELLEEMHVCTRGITMGTRA